MQYDPLKCKSQALWCRGKFFTLALHKGVPQARLCAWRAQVVRYNDGTRSQKYICWTRKQMRYMLGDHGYSYVVGNDPPKKPGQFPKRVHNRAASCPAPPANCSQVTALYNPQDNPNTISGGLVLVRAHLNHSGLISVQEPTVAFCDTSCGAECHLSEPESVWSK